VGTLYQSAGGVRLNIMILVIEKYKLKRCSKTNVVNNVDMSSLRETMTQWPVQNPSHRTTQKHVEHHDATDIKNTIFVFFFGVLFLFIFYFINNFLNKLVIESKMSPLRQLHVPVHLK